MGRMLPMATMTRSMSSRQGGAVQAPVKPYPADSPRFDFVYAILTGVFAFGLFLDGWAHNHGKVDNTFFTPWHAVLYSAFFLNGLVLGIVLLLNHRRGRSWLTALP